jgi:hypothetical protein
MIAVGGTAMPNMPRKWERFGSFRCWWNSNAECATPNVVKQFIQKQTTDELITS